MQKLDEGAKGVYVITVTPFTDDGALDLASTDRVVDFYLEKGANGLTVLGVMGEYIGRMYMETKKRPLFIIAQRTRKVRATPQGGN